ncbi:MAG: PfkB family carbohydrate kinase, partial [Verrucomicrobiota bacterium]
DREKRRSIGADQVKSLMQKLTAVLPDLNGIIIEDYGKGLVTAELVDAILKAAEPHDLVITVDPKPGNPIEWRGVTTVKPNRSEAFACAGVEDLNRDTGLDPLKDEPLLDVGQALLQKWACHQVLLTLGEQGMLVFSHGEEPVLMPAKAREVFDVSGAGDTAIAIYTLCLCAGLSASASAGIANLASSIVVGKLGTSPIEKAELLESIQREYPQGLPLS